MKKHLDFKKCQKNIFDRNTTCLEVVKSYLERIKEKKDLNIFIEVCWNFPISSTMYRIL